MSLKCPICGKEYYYDSKICQACEDESNNSGLLYTFKKSKNWNCGLFLEFENLTFDHQKPDEVYIKIASEPKFSDYKPKVEYIWNCDSRFRFKNFFNLKYGISQLEAVKKVSLMDLKIFEKEKNYSLIYE